MDEKKRIRRSAEQRVEEIDEKIAKYQETLADLDNKRADAMMAFDEKEKSIKEKIQMLTDKKEGILNPQPIKRRRRSKKQKLADIVNRLSKSGLKPEEIMEKLGLEEDM